MLLLGSTGAGKSSVGNMIANNSNAFVESDDYLPVTLEPKVFTVIHNQCKLNIIDTEGLSDSRSNSSVQIQKLANFLMEFEKPITSVCLVINGQAPRFAQGEKDLLQFIYNYFGNNECLNNICVVFTKCYNDYSPNINMLSSKYRTEIRSYLSELSGYPLSSIPEIPFFFVDTKDPENDMNQQLINWSISRNISNVLE